MNRYKIILKFIPYKRHTCKSKWPEGVEIYILLLFWLQIQILRSILHGKTALHIHYLHSTYLYSLDLYIRTDLYSLDLYSTDLYRVDLFSPDFYSTDLNSSELTVQISTV